MSTVREKLEALEAELAEQRDEMRLQLHLFQADAREEWEKLEARWDSVKAKLESVGDEAADVAEDVGEASKLLFDEIRAGYGRLRKLL